MSGWFKEKGPLERVAIHFTRPNGNYIGSAEQALVRSSVPLCRRECPQVWRSLPCQTRHTALSPSHPATIDSAMRSSVMVLGLSLLGAADLAAQTEAETQRATLIGLRSFGVHASVQVSQGAT